MASVSAVIPTYNRLPYLRRALRSVLNQSRPADEVVVVDDGSTDGTAQKLREDYAGRVRVVGQPNTGVAGARRKGVLEARGDWIAFLDSDDEWTADHMEVLVRAAEQVPGDVAWVFGDTLIDTGADCTSLFQEHQFRVDGPVQVFDNPMPTQYPLQFSFIQSSLIRRSVLLEVGAFSEGVRSSEDLLAGWQVAARYRMAAVPQAVTRLYRTADLAATSMDRMGRVSPDYHRARVLGYSVLACSPRPGPWRVHHSESVRRYCLRLAETQPHVNGLRRLALQQFQHSIDPRAVLFMAAALFGKPGLRAWQWAVRRRDRIRPTQGPLPEGLFSHADSKPEPANARHD